MARDRTINLDAYCVKMRILRCAIQSKRCGLLSSGVILLYDNAKQCTSAKIQVQIRSSGCKKLDKPPYNPDLAVNFTCFISFLGGQWFNDDEVKTSVMDWISSQPADFFDVEIQSGYDIYLNKNGNLVKNLIKLCKLWKNIFQ